MVSTRPSTSKSNSPFNNPLLTVPKSPIAIVIIVKFIFHSIFFISLDRSRYLSFFLLFFSVLFCGQPGQQSTILQVLFFLLFTIRSGILAEIRWSVCMPTAHRSLCVSFSRTYYGLCIYYQFVWSYLNFNHISKWITLFPQSCLVLYFFCSNVPHSLVMRLIVSSLSPHNLHLLFCCILLILSFNWLFLMALFCASIKRGSVSLLMFPFLSHVQDFSCEMLLISRLKRP